MQNSDKTEKVLFQPKIFQFSLANERSEFEDVVSRFDPEIKNTLPGQAADLVGCLYPDEAQRGVPRQSLVERWLNGRTLEEAANIVYYPWRNSAAWILTENDFATTRTNRNKVKIPGEIQEKLTHKNVLFIGLSVGQSAATTFAMQRLCGHFHLADFDELSLSNMNRLRASVLDIDLPKTVIAARQIAEQDPYLRISCYHHGATADNLDDLITMNGTGKVDLIVEECDSLPIKLLVRQKARFHKVPVIMDTSDRGMVDIERFDLEENRPIFHGLISDEDIAALDGNNDPGARFALLKKIVNIDQVSNGMKASLALMGSALLTWPQLASEVTLGGALTTYVGYKILAGEQMDSGRIYVDLEEIFKKGREWT
jgi:molybdopterin/thiamine biosynthesis adenylyltransferase